MLGINDFNAPIVDFANFNVSSLVSALGFGGAMVLIGMATVFAVLILLLICLILFKVFFHDIPQKKAKAPKSTVAPVQEAIVTQSSDTEIIAVLAAAVAMAESESGGIKFNVVSFKRK